uniref:GSVIVT01001600001 n=1 Tax=Arundo donax TaxID=35708 RepID=A0A0A9EXU0_ARUDO
MNHLLAFLCRLCQIHLYQECSYC